MNFYSLIYAYRALIDVQAVCAAALTPLGCWNIGLTVVERGLRRTDINDIDDNAVPHPTNGGSTISTFVAYLKALTTSRRWACGAFVARNGLLSITKHTMSHFSTSRTGEVGPG